MAHHIADDQCGEEDEYHDQDDELTGVIVCSMADQMSDDGEEEIDENDKDGCNQMKGSSKTDILTSDELVDLFRSHKRFENEDITVGFIGYPNVGKSSTINKLLTYKKVINLEKLT